MLVLLDPLRDKVLPLRTAKITSGAAPSNRSAMQVIVVVVGGGVVSISFSAIMIRNPIFNFFRATPLSSHKK